MPTTPPWRAPTTSPPPHPHFIPGLLHCCNHRGAAVELLGFGLVGGHTRRHSGSSRLRPMRNAGDRTLTPQPIKATFHPEKSKGHFHRGWGAGRRPGAARPGWPGHSWGGRLKGRFPVKTSRCFRDRRREASLGEPETSGDQARLSQSPSPWSPSPSMHLQQGGSATSRGALGGGGLRLGGSGAALGRQLSGSGDTLGRALGCIRRRRRRHSGRLPL